VLLGSSILEVGLGLALFFLLLAIIVSSINEVIARMFRLRSRTLRSGIGQLLADPTTQGFAGLVLSHPLIQALEKSGRPSYLRDRTFAIALIDTIQRDAASVSVVANAVANDPNLPLDLRRQLNLLIQEANGDFERLQRGIEGWFNDSMDRVSGWYKRKAQLVTFGVALVLSLLLNADSLRLAAAMVANPAAREAFVAQAAQIQPTASGEPGIPDTSVTDIQKALEPAGYSLGWAMVDANDPVGWFANARNWLGFVPGWLITTFAILMGAPFWFDVVSKVANIRSGGLKPPKSGD
jgi:hypothetical protein